MIIIVSPRDLARNDISSIPVQEDLGYEPLVIITKQETILPVFVVGTWDLLIKIVCLIKLESYLAELRSLRYDLDLILLHDLSWWCRGDWLIDLGKVRVVLKFSLINEDISVSKLHHALLPTPVLLLREGLFFSAKAFAWNFLWVEISNPNIIEFIPLFFTVFEPCSFLLFDVRVVMPTLCSAWVDNSTH